MPAFAILAMISYLLSLGLIIPSLVQNNRAYRRLALLFAAIAL
ncbi:MAG: inner membrane protein YpjD, partial [Enterobacterales bacterium]|nr:inner membrane protein YpjD [Enterobacterales bacterium]